MTAVASPPLPQLDDFSIRLSNLLIPDTFHYVVIAAHRNGSLAVGQSHAVVDRVDVGADENDKRIEQSVVLPG
jgi:hypothetical protein